VYFWRSWDLSVSMRRNTRVLLALLGLECQYEEECMCTSGAPVSGVSYMSL
jgi:hypothetical protein